MANHLVLLKSDFFAHEQQAVAVADRYPQDVFAEHTHEFCELVLVWRGNGLHVLNDRPYRITRGDLFYIRAEDKHSYTSVNDLVLQNIIYCPERLTLNVDWQGAIPGFDGAPRHPHWRLGSVGMSQARQVISQLEHESNQRDAFELNKFCERERCSERVLRQQFRSQTGMTINQYLRQVRVCHAQYLLKHSRLMISEISMRCGFEDSNYFSVVFTRETGMTPSQWRHLSTQHD